MTEYQRQQIAMNLAFDLLIALRNVDNDKFRNEVIECLANNDGDKLYKVGEEFDLFD